MIAPRIPDSGTTIYRADHHRDLEVLGALVGSAFADLSAVRWLVPEDRDTRKLVFGGWAEIHTANAMAHGRVDAIDLTGMPVAVAVSFTDPHADPAPDYKQQRLRAVGRRHDDRFATLEAAMAEGHPHDTHHYLLFLAVRPGHQNQGYGSALLDHYHQGLDEAGTPAYLEAASPHSRRLYERHGYTWFGQPLTLPDAPGPALWPMWRKPQPAESSH